jgi:TfoX/Sxy family transcriptional regulator of competence genes
MAYDEALADRIRQALANEPAVTERKMFGGIAFMVAGNMACGVIGDDLMVRVGPDAHAAALAEPHVRPMDFANRPMQGYVYVDPDGVRSAEDLARWVHAGAVVATSLPPK